MSLSPAVGTVGLSKMDYYSWLLGRKGVGRVQRRALSEAGSYLLPPSSGV